MAGIEREPAGQVVSFRSDILVDLVEVTGSDSTVAAAARVSTRASQRRPAPERDAGLINYLMRNRHGTPFEHNYLSFYVEAPIFVTRQMLKHRIGVSINEESGRYRQFRPVFYVPTDRTRPLVQVGRPGDYGYNPGTDAQWNLMTEAVREVLTLSWSLYQRLLHAGISNEVARMNLPLCTFSSLQISFNTRSLMHFISLRGNALDAAYVSHPQWETAQVAAAMEEHFNRAFPLVHTAFVEYGRVAP